MKWISGIFFIGLPLIVLFTNYCFPFPQKTSTLFYYFSSLAITFGALALIPFKRIPDFIFDNQEWKRNDNIFELVRKIRLRAVLFFNISVIIFIVTIVVIAVGFYILIRRDADAKPADTITLRVSATAILIFLVQILFRLFKYLLRIAAFYTGKADAMEFHKINNGIELEKLMEMFTPDKYDITDISSPSLFDKGKTG